MVALLLHLWACGPASVSVGGGGGAEDSAAVETVGGDTSVDWVWCEDAPALVLNELVAANHHGITDTDGDTSDWLELALGGADALDVGGWGLSQDGVSTWALPSVTLAAGDTLRIFASGKDRADTAELHADFGIDAFGDALFLHMPDGCVADRVDTPRLYADVSYGRDSDGAWAYFLESTPGVRNTTESRPGFAELPTFDSTPGYAAAPIAVGIEGEGSVFYTLDGSVPTDTSAAYTGPVTLDTSTHPVVVRARAYVDGLWPSRVATGTWWSDGTILDGGVQVISLTVDPPDLWDEASGIYVPGPNAEAGYPYFGANFWQVWEKDLHVEIWEPDGTRVVAQDAGIQIAGGWSRAFDQRNFELIPRAGYSEETFDASLFDDESIERFRRLYLRNGGDWCSTQILDGTVSALFRDADGRRLDAVDAQAYEPVLVYLNGDFWGVYELKERLDENWIADHRGEDPDALDRVKLGWTHEPNWELEQGTWDAFEALNGFAARDLTNPSEYAEFTAAVDLENFVSANVAHGWIANTDWWSNNIRMWRPARDDGRWRWMVYDFGHGWADWRYDHLATTLSGSNWTGLPLGSALANQEFRDLFVNVHADYLNTTMSAENAAATVRALADEVRPVMAKQRERWCGGAQMDSWEAAIAYAETFAQQRPATIDAGLVARMGLAGHASLTLQAEPEEAGVFRLAVVTVESGFDGTYYRGVPVTVTAVPNPGWTFAGWGDGLGSDTTVVLPMEGDTSVTATFTAR